MTIFFRKTGPSEAVTNLVAAIRDSSDVQCVVSTKDTFGRSGLFLNYHNREDPNVNRSSYVLNKKAARLVARNKLLTFTALSHAGGIPIPEYWTDRSLVVRSGSQKILERHSLTASGGDGIVVKRVGEELGQAPLYVKYIPKHKEYRVHVFYGRAIIIQEKRRSSGQERSQDDELIRNHANGWVFCVGDIDPSTSAVVSRTALRACAELNIDFGAVDIVVGRDDNIGYVLEVNTCPGMTSPTVLEAYAAALVSLHQEFIH